MKVSAAKLTAKLKPTIIMPIRSKEGLFQKHGPKQSKMKCEKVRNEILTKISHWEWLSVVHERGLYGAIEKYFY